MNIQEKQVIVDDLTASFGQASASIIVEFKGCSCSEITELRRKLKPVGGRFAVVKNTLTKRALVSEQVEELREVLKGSTAVVFTGNDPVSPAKVVTEFAKNKETFAIKGGIVEGKVVPAARIQDLADLPSREQLLANLLGLLNAPATQLLRVISAPATDLVRLLEAWRGKLAEKGD